MSHRITKATPAPGEGAGAIAPPVPFTWMDFSFESLPPRALDHIVQHLALPDLFSLRLSAAAAFGGASDARLRYIFAARVHDLHFL